MEGMATRAEGLLEVTARRGDGQLLPVMLLGSTIGKFDDAAGLGFLRQLRNS